MDYWIRPCRIAASFLIFALLFVTHAAGEPKIRKKSAYEIRRESNFLIQCYLPSWSITNGYIQVSDINPTGTCNTIVYAFFKVADNQLSAMDNKFPAHFAQLRQLREQNRDLRIHLSVGGWTNTAEMSMMASSAANRTRFVSSATTTLRKLGVDGLDVDWEYPEDHEKGNYVTLLKELRGAFDLDAGSSGRSRLALTVAVGPTVRSSYDVAEMSKYLDVINVMTYDYHGFFDQQKNISGPNAALPDVKNSIHKWNDAGAPTEKLSIGLAFYGRSWTLEKPFYVQQKLNTSSRRAVGMGLPGLVTKTEGILSYAEICDNQRSGWKSGRDQAGDVPHIYSGSQWVSFDDPTSIASKVLWAEKSKLHGAFIWHLAQDDVADRAE